MATTLKIKENWSDIKKNLKKEYPELNDKDLTYKEGKENDLVVRLQEKLEKKRDQVIDIINKAQKEISKSEHQKETTAKAKERKEKHPAEMEWQEEE